MTQRVKPSTARLAADDLDDALKQYIFDTVRRQARVGRRRQLGLALALIGGIVAFQWPVGFDSARAIPTNVASLEAPGGRIADAADTAMTADRFAFAGAVRESF